MAREFYFAYGSNLWPGRLSARIGEFEIVSRACLVSYRLQFNKRGGDGSAKCNAHFTGQSGDVLTGVVYAVNHHQRAELDVFEGVGHGYHRARIELTEVDGVTRLDAFTYVATEGHVFRQPLDESDRGRRVLPFCWYKDFVLHGARYHQLEPAAIAGIEAHPIQPDEDAVRRTKNNRLLTLSMREAAALYGSDAVT